MSAIEFNKIAGAVLFALLAMFGARTVSNIIFTPHGDQKPGYEIVTGDGGGPAGQSAGEAVPLQSLAQLLSAADAAKGQSVSKKCASCHTFNEGGAHRVGPNLYDIVGKKPGAASGYAYSVVIVSKGPWTYEALDKFVTDPKGFAPGTKMAFAGIKKASQRADLIAYMRSLSAAPKPLPKAEPAAPVATEPPAAAEPPATAEPPAAAKPAPEPAQMPDKDASAPMPSKESGGGRTDSAGLRADGEGTAIDLLPASDPEPTGSISTSAEEKQGPPVALPERNTKRASAESKR